MHRNKLLNLLANNARKGEFKAEGNTIYLYDVIVSSKAEAEWFGGVDAESFVQALNGMTGDVSVRINSPGGDVFGAKAMAQAIRVYPGNVTAYVDGYAASAATFITSAADKTVMAQGAMMMVHKAWSIGMGNSDDFVATAALLEKIDGTIAETYAEAAGARGVEAPDFAAMMAAETWLTDQEAVNAGLADEVLVGVAKPSAAWDLSVYDNAPAPVEAAPVIEPDPVAEVVEAAPVIEPVNNEIERLRRVTAFRLSTPA